MELSQQGANKPCCGGSFLQFGKTAAQLMLRLMFLDSAVQDCNRYGPCSKN